MTTTRKTAAERTQQRQQRELLETSAGRRQEAVLLVLVSIVLAMGLGLVYSAKTRSFAASGHAVNLSRLSGWQQLLPYLSSLPSDSDRELVARRIEDATHFGRHLPNVGAIARIRVDSKPLLTASQLSRIKPWFIVRGPGDFRRSFFTWTVLYFLAFYAVHIAWRLRRFAGDNLLLPIIHLLSGVGLILMISLRDPLRDTLTFADFTQGVIVGCIAIFLFTLLNFERQFARYSFLPLIAAIVLAAALGIFGSGPGTSDAKVNLLGFQPVELIRILLVLFLAGYFAQNWDALRDLRQKHGRLAARFNVPRLDYVLPVALGVVAALILFFWLSDLGPALVVGCLFLVLYSVARNRAGLALAGLAVIVFGFWAGHAIGYPRTVTQRVNMWRAPWDNTVRGGDQVAHSLWSLASGGATGTGPGLGDPAIMPAAHTDLILSALGEELGFIGLVGVYLLYGILIYRSLRIAMRAPGVYSFFLVLGLALITALQILLISGGLLGLIPLSGVVSPFLSYGRTSMVANFALFGIILSVSAALPKKDQSSKFGASVGWLGGLLAASLCLLIARAAYVQIARADNILVRGALITQADGVRRYEYNPRLLEAARQLPKGDIFDRNGLPLATSSPAILEAHRADYEKLGVPLETGGGRQYPLGPPLFYLLGDVRTQLKQGASNTAFQERASRIRLQGYNDAAEIEEVRDPKTGAVIRRLRYDYSELVPLLRHRWQPENAAVKAILARNRDVHMSIDARLQMRASAILRDNLARLGKERGAIVVLEPSTGDLLAAVSYPWPTAAQFAALNEAETSAEDLLDRARYGLYPPGSSFKIVTAIAALNKSPSLAHDRFDCIRLPDGRVGNFVNKREIRDDIKDTAPHGSVDLARGIILSCNAFFAQLGTYRVGAQALQQTAAQFGIQTGNLQQALPQASYGQGQVVASPFQMARVAAAIANGGNAPQGRWVIDETNPRTREPRPVLSRDLANEIAGYMRAVVTSGTGRVLAKSAVPIAGKTGTAELANALSHAWFIGFAPYGARPGAKQIAFAVLVENGQYGGTAAAPIAGEVVAAAKQLGLL